MNKYKTYLKEATDQPGLKQVKDTVVTLPSGEERNISKELKDTNKVTNASMFGKLQTVDSEYETKYKEGENDFHRPIRWNLANSTKKAFDKGVPFGGLMGIFTVAHEMGFYVVTIPVSKEPRQVADPKDNSKTIEVPNESEFAFYSHNSEDPHFYNQIINTTENIDAVKKNITKFREALYSKKYTELTLNWTEPNGEQYRFLFLLTSPEQKKAMKAKQADITKAYEDVHGAKEKRVLNYQDKSDQSNIAQEEDEYPRGRVEYVLAYLDKNNNGILKQMTSFKLNSVMAEANAVIGTKKMLFRTPPIDIALPIEITPDNSYDRAVKTKGVVMQAMHNKVYRYRAEFFISLANKL